MNYVVFLKAFFEHKFSYNEVFIDKKGPFIYMLILKKVCINSLKFINLFYLR